MTELVSKRRPQRRTVHCCSVWLLLATGVVTMIAKTQHQQQHFPLLFVEGFNSNSIQHQRQSSKLRQKTGKFLSSSPCASSFKASKTQLNLSSFGEDDDSNSNKIMKSNDEWKDILTSEQYYVLREEGTERPFSSSLNDIKPSPSVSGTGGGTFVCAGCNNPLFTLRSKYDSGTGWPSFTTPVDKNAVEFTTDYKLLLPRVECHCSKCDGHLGHVFNDGPSTSTTGQRFCMNGVAMKYVSDMENPELATSIQERTNSETTMYKPLLSQVLPGAAINAMIGIFFFGAFVSRIDELFANGISMSTPLEIFPLLPAIYYGVLAANSIKRIS